MGIEKVACVTQPSWDALLVIKNREIWKHNGTCSCGKRTYLSGQCSKCIRDEASDRHRVAQEIAKDAGNEAEVELLESPPVVASTALIPSLPSGHRWHSWVHSRKAVFVTNKAIHEVAKSNDKGWIVVGREANLPDTQASIRMWKTRTDIELPTPPKSVDKPFRMVFAVRPDGGVLLVQQCVTWKNETVHTLDRKAWDPDLSLLSNSEWPQMQDALVAIWGNYKKMPVNKYVILEKWFNEAEDRVAKLFSAVMPVEVIMVAHMPGGIPRGTMAELEVKMHTKGYTAETCQDGAVFSWYNDRWDLRRVGRLGLGAEPVGLKESDWHIFLIGRKGAEQVRKLVTIVGSRWMYHDPEGDLLRAPVKLKTARNLSKKVSLVGTSDSERSRADTAPASSADPIPVHATAKEDKPWTVVKGGLVEMDQEAKEWYDKAYQKREKLAGEAREECGDTQFSRRKSQNHLVGSSKGRSSFDSTLP